jgi:N-acetylglucosaminyl-diphospho-decaprenol L-rhamnosyltransferase
MDVSAVIPNKDGSGMIGRCVEAALAAGATEAIVVDDGSSDDSPDEAERAGALVLRSPGRGFAAAVNAGAASASGAALLVLNSDCFLQGDAARRLAATLEARPGLGLCAAALVELDGTPGKTHGPALTLGLALRTALSLVDQTRRPTGSGVEEVEFVPLACAAVRRAAWEELGGLDERFFFYFEDQDVCRRLRSSGFGLAVDWDATATHVGGASSAVRNRQRWFLQYVRSRARYLRKHYRRTWLLFAVVWVPSAVVRAAAWAVRRGPSARGWARTWLVAARAGISG